MTTLYVDYTSGNDTTGDGTAALPYKTYSKAYTILAGNGEHTIKLKRGTTEPISAAVSMRSGTSATQRSKLEAWYNADGTDNPSKAKPILQASAAINFGIMWHLNGSVYKTIKNVVFDCAGLARYGVQIYADTTLINDITHDGCVFKRSLRDAFYVQSDGASYPGVTGINVVRCRMESAGRHGAHNVGNVNCVYRACVAQDAGPNEPTEGSHGFSSIGVYTTSTSGWTLVSGTIYKRTAATTVASVTGFVNGSYIGLASNTSTPSTPGTNGWGQTGGELYIDVGRDPNSLTTIFWSTYRPTVRYYDCVATRTLLLANLSEGVGFQADAMSVNVEFVRCKSYGNEGGGFYSNMSENTVVRSCVGYANGRMGYGAIMSPGGTIDHCTFFGNNQNGAANDQYEIAIYGGCQNTAVKNTVAQGQDSPAGIYAVLFQGTSTTGSSATYSYLNSNTGAINGSVTTSNNSTADPEIGSKGAPIAGSPLIGTGLHAGYIRAINGQFSNPPAIGAYEPLRARTTR